jgi:hypothetical protein
VSGVLLVCAASSAALAAGGARSVVGAWRAVKQIEEGKVTEVPANKVILWEFLKGGTFVSTTERLQGKFPVRSTGKWKLRGALLAIELDGLTREFRPRIVGQRLELTEVKQGKAQRQFFLVRAPAAGPPPKKAPTGR